MPICPRGARFALSPPLPDADGLKARGSFVHHSNTRFSMSLSHPVRVSLIGLGALGILHARDLHNRPDLCTLACIADAQRQKRYAREGIFCNNERLDLPLVTPQEQPAHKADLVMVCVKATGLEQAIRDIANHVGEGTIIISLLNGVTSEEMLREAYPMARVVHCIAQGMDALRVDQKLTCAQHGKLVIGTDREELADTVQDLAAFFAEVGIPHMVDRDILHRLYAKWMFNCGINQTITVFEGTYGTLQHEGRPREVFKDAMREAAAVANAQGIALNQKDFDEYVALADALSPESMPSMRQDALAHRPTEVELFSGTLLAKAKKFGISAPVNAWLYEKITALEK